MNKIISLNNLELKTFTEQDVLDYCSINNINPNSITVLDLSFNQLTDISGIRLFKNLKDLYISYNNITNILNLKYLNKLEYLFLNNNQITDISVFQYLNKLEYLNIGNLELYSDQIQYIQSIDNLKKLYSSKGFKDILVLNQLNKNIEIIK